MSYHYLKHPKTAYNPSLAVFQSSSLKFCESCEPSLIAIDLEGLTEFEAIEKLKKGLERYERVL